MSNITKITDHADQAIARSREHMRGKTNWENLIRVLVNPVQDIEDVLWQLLTERAIDTAVGTQLEVIGRIVGQLREGRPDADYRRFIKAKIATNRSSGSLEELIKISVLILDDVTASIKTTNFFPAAVHIQILNITLTESTAEILMTFLRKAVIGGVRINFQYSSVPAAEAFTYSRCTFANGAIGAAATTINVNSTAGFPTSGSLTLSIGLAVEEDVTYTGITATSFTGVSATANAHVDNTTVQVLNDPAKGFLQTATPTFVAIANTQSGGGVGSMVINKPTGTQENDIMVMTHWGFNSTSQITAAPAGWNQEFHIQRTIESQQHNFYVYTKTAGPSEPSSYTWTLNGTSAGKQGMIASYRGASSVAVTASTSDTGPGESSGHTEGGLTTLTDKNRVVTIFGFDNNAAGSWSIAGAPGWLTNRLDQNGADSSMKLYVSDGEQAMAGSTGSIVISTVPVTVQGIAATIALDPEPTGGKYVDVKE